jgi:predicted nucleotidyltransferase
LKKITVLVKKELKILNLDDLKDLERLLEKLLENNLLDEVLILDNETKISNLHLEYINESLRDLSNLKERTKKLEKEVFEIKELLKEVIVTLKHLTFKEEK